MAGQLAQPFRLLDLPAELRIMVYEHISFTTRHYILEDPYFPGKHPEATEPSTITFIAKSLPLALLRTSKTIRAEALPYLIPTMEQLRQEPQRMIVDSPSLDIFRVILYVTSNIHSWPTPFLSSTTRLKDQDAFCKACAFSLLARFPKMAVEKVKKGVVAIRRHPSCDLSDLTSAVRRLRNELHAGGDYHEVFGKQKRIVLLSDAQFGSKEDAAMAAKLQKRFDVIGKEPTYMVWDIKIGGGLVLGREEWREHWAEG